MKKGWGQATGWAECFVSLSALTLMAGWKEERPACKKPPLLISKDSPPEQVKEENQG